MELIKEYENIQMLFPFCLWLLPVNTWLIFVKNRFFRRRERDFPEWLKGENESDSVVKLQLHPLHLLCTLPPGDSCYQTKNKRKNNLGVSINMDKLKISNTLSLMRTLY